MLFELWLCSSALDLSVIYVFATLCPSGSPKQEWGNAKSSLLVRCTKQVVLDLAIILRSQYSIRVYSRSIHELTHPASLKVWR